MTNWFEKKRLADQLKFFGAKKQQFISCYAKKPRIVMRVKKVIALNPHSRLARERQLSDLQFQQLGMGIYGSSLGMQQNAAMNMAQAQLNGCLGNLAGLGQGMPRGLFGGSWI